MGLECAIIIVDNSDYSRNGDTHPNRLGAQLEVSNFFATRICNLNQESSVGLMCSAGNNCEVLSTPTHEPSTLVSTYSRILSYGRSNINKSLTIAMLALKHRTNKNQHIRIILFVASKLLLSLEELLKKAGDLRRNNIRLDIINLCNDSNMPYLTQFHQAANAGGEGYIINHSPGITKLLSTVQNLMLSQNESNPNSFNEDEDQEYLLAIQLSLQEAEKQAINSVDVEKDSETTALLKQAEDIAKAPNDDTQFDNEKELIEEVLKDLNLNLDSAKIQDILKRDQPPKKDEDKL